MDGCLDMRPEEERRGERELLSATLKLHATIKRLENIEEDSKELADKLKGTVHEPLALGIHAVAIEALMGLDVNVDTTDADGKCVRCKVRPSLFSMRCKECYENMVRGEERSCDGNY